MQTNKLYLFYPATLLGWIISLVTRSPFSHAAIEIDGQLWDSSERRGSFGRSDIDVSRRRHLCLPFRGDLGVWLAHMHGKKYDWLGVLGWLFKANDRGRFYCFEAAWLALYDAGIVDSAEESQLSGSDLVAAMVEYHHRVPGGMVCGSAMLIVQTIRFENRKKLGGWLASRKGRVIASRIVDVTLDLTSTRSVYEALDVLCASKAALIAVEQRLYALLGDWEAEWGGAL